MDSSLSTEAANTTPTQALSWRWVHTGDGAFDSMVSSIEQARVSVDFETYIFTDSIPGRRLLEALTQAAGRGVHVRVLIDAFGSLMLPDTFWEPLRQAGGSVRRFNPFNLRHFNIRNHRKLLVCDAKVAFIGGFNVSDQWLGDGLKQGWRDLGLIIHGSIANTLIDSFDKMFELADFRHSYPQRLRPRRGVIMESASEARVLSTGPGRGRHPIREALLRDLRHAREVRIIASYFLPPGRLLRALKRVARRGGLVQLILPAQSDVFLMQSATRGLYGGLLRSKIRIHEYKPRILHTKFIQIDQAVYLGSANLDRRSFGINYELLVRFDNPELAAEGQAVFERYLQHSAPGDKLAWQRSRTWWERIREWLACAIFARIDPFVTRTQLRDPR